MDLPAGTSVLDPSVETLHRDARTRAVNPLQRRDRIASVSIGGGFLVVALLLPLVAGAGLPNLLMAFALVAAYAFCARIEFEIGSGSAVPTQVVFIPMLFALPPAWVPLAVGAGYAATLVVDVARGRRHAERIFVLLASSTYSLGPALVFLALGIHDPSWKHIHYYPLALAAQFLVDGLVACAREWFVLGVTPARLAPFLARAYGVDFLLSPLGLLAVYATPLDGYGFLFAVPFLALLAYFAQQRRDHIDQALELSGAYRGTALLLGDMIEADDEYTGSHSRSVVELVVSVSEKLGLDAKELRLAEFAALLHDVGKIRVPKEIINKRGPLEPAERAVIERHTIEGELLLRKVGGLLGGVGTVVRSCHERFDGRGYPDGLVGEEIPLAARVVCCCDAFNAMTTDRPYRGARSTAEAVAELRACAGTQFDPDVVAALVEVVLETQPDSLVGVGAAA